MRKGHLYRGTVLRRDTVYLTPIVFGQSDQYEHNLRDATYSGTGIIKCLEDEKRLTLGQKTQRSGFPSAQAYEADE